MLKLTYQMDLMDLDACFGFGYKICPLFKFKCHFNNCLQPIGKAKGFLISQITSGEEGRDSKLNYNIFYIIIKLLRFESKRKESLRKY